MNVIAEIKEKLKKYPALSYEEDSNSISVTPDGGFTVWVTENGSSYTVGFEGWHEEFENPVEALNCFAWGLSDECRLKIISRGGVPYKWIAQSYEDGYWVDSSTTGLLIFPFWRQATTGYKQNAVINS